MSSNNRVTDEEALALHAEGRPGKIEIIPSKPLVTQRDLSLAYSPGVAAPCLRIKENPDCAYDYTIRGNLVAVISNGTAVLGLGNLGALAAKPVMEGKAVLFKRFADIDSIDLEVDTQDIDAFVNAVKYLGPSFGGINLEDIKAPDCFIIEEQLRELLDIPVFHDDQHGTAIIACAGLINALELTGRQIDTARIVINGAGAAGIATADLMVALGVPRGQIILCDTGGVIWRGREDGMNQWKSAYAADTEARTLYDAMCGADVFIGLSVKGAVTADMVKAMAPKPIIFALANPDPEILPEDVKAVRDDAIMATGRSDYPNQVNNVLGFPFIFRGALDVRAKAINEPMKIAAARALAQLAREDVPDEVDRAYDGRRLRFGPDYIIPVPFDPRLITTIPPAVAQAAVDSGVARRPLEDAKAYRASLRRRQDPAADRLEALLASVRGQNRRVVFAEGEEERAIRAAISFRQEGYGTPILVGRGDIIAERCRNLGLGRVTDLIIANAAIDPHVPDYVEQLYARHQRRGFLLRDCQRLINTNRNVFAASLVAAGQADAMITGLTRSFAACQEELKLVIGPGPDNAVFGLSLLIHRGHSLFIADSAVCETPDAETLARVATATAQITRQLGQRPRVAFLSFTSFGRTPSERSGAMRAAVALLDQQRPDFEYDGEMAVDVALDYELMARLFPFSRLTGPANVLIMPDLHAAHIATRLLCKTAGATLIGPLLIGQSHSAQIVPMGASVAEIVQSAALAVHGALSGQMSHRD